MDMEIRCYTDGSYNVQLKVGGWAAIILVDDRKIVLKKIEHNMNHNRLELISVIESVYYILQHYDQKTLIKIYTDSQYVSEISRRKEKLTKKNFKTAKGSDIRNVDLVKKLIDILESNEIEIVKVKAHQKKEEKENYNREADKISRKIVRDFIKKNLMT